MPEDALYPEDTADSMPPDQDEESSEPQDNPEEESKEEKKPEGYTELINKKLLHIGDDETLKPGQEFTVKVIKDYGDEAEIECVKKKKNSSEMSADEEIDQMHSSGMMKGY